jgi:hypothetical protein
MGASALVRVGESSLSPNDPGRLVSQVWPLAERVDGRVVLDVSKAALFNCAWLNALIDLHHRCDRLGGRLVVVGLSREARLLVEDCGLGASLNLAESESEARGAHEALGPSDKAAPARTPTLLGRMLGKSGSRAA